MNGMEKVPDPFSPFPSLTPFPSFSLFLSSPTCPVTTIRMATLYRQAGGRSMRSIRSGSLTHH